MKKPNIFVIGPVPPPYYGVSIIITSILESDLKENYNVIHVDTSDRRGLANIGKLDFQNVWLAIKHVIELIRLLHKNKPDIVYLPICQSVIGILRDSIFMFLSKIKSADIIVHLHGGYFRKMYEEASLLGKVIIKCACAIASRAIVLGESLRYIFEGLVPADRIAVVAVGLDKNYITVRDLQRGLLSRKNSQRSEFSILFFSNLALSKGFFDVIKAIPTVIKHQENIRFMFAGEFWDTEKTRQEMQQYVKDFSLESHIEFTGRAIGTRKKELLISSDIFVLPTYYPLEGQPTVILEAMAAGMPIISTDQGCIREMVIDGENGFIIEKQNPNQIAEKIITLMENDNLRHKMGEKSRERFLRDYTKYSFISKLSDVFTSVLSERS